MAAAQKKVIVRQFEGGLAWGYLPQAGFAQGGVVALMEVDGRARRLELGQIKWVCYVRDFNLDDGVEPERIGRRTFQARPRGDGLWLRLVFRDGEALEGLAGVDLGLLDALVGDGGLFLTPPDLRSNALRIFVPRAAIGGMEVLGMVTAPSKRLAAKKRAGVAAETQPGLFGGLFGE